MLLGRKYGKLERYRKKATCPVNPSRIQGKDSEQNILTIPVMTVDFPWARPDFFGKESFDRYRQGR